MNFARRYPVFELANWMTLVRLPLAGALLLRPGDTTWILWILAIAALTDMLDGRLARALRAEQLEQGAELEDLGRRHATGAWLDPLCDKAFVLSALLAIYLGAHPPAWMLFTVAARELLIIPCAIAYRSSASLRKSFRFDFRAGYLGKLATVAQFFAIVGMLLGFPHLTYLVITTGAIGIAAALHYLHKAIRFARWLTMNEGAYEKLSRLRSMAPTAVWTP